jgi:hypothetical protein
LLDVCGLTEKQVNCLKFYIPIPTRDFVSLKAGLKGLQLTMKSVWELLPTFINMSSIGIIGFCLTFLSNRAVLMSDCELCQTP